ncbi:MAG: hypothetical protein ABIJ12_07290, partial [bacterium]
MRLRIILSLIVILAFSVAPALADDTGVLDTVILVPTVIPDASTGTDQLVIEYWAYTDETVLGFSSGFDWDNPNMQITSATSGVTNAFTIKSYFENDNMAMTNTNHRFLYGGLDFGLGLAPASNRRLWATYTCTVSGWDSSSVINIDTLTFSAASTWLFSTDAGNVYPIWAGALEIRDSSYHPPAPANLVVNQSVLNFTAVEGGTNPANKLFNVASDADPLGFNITEFTGSAWLSAAPLTGTTPLDISVAINITGLADGSYKDTLVVASGTAVNSPQYVEVNLTVTPAPSNLVVSETELNFTAVEGGANPSNKLFNIASDNDPLGFNITEFTGSDWLSSTPNTGTT